MARQVCSRTRYGGRPNCPISAPLSGHSATTVQQLKPTSSEENNQILLCFCTDFANWLESFNTRGGIQKISTNPIVEIIKYKQISGRLPSACLICLLPEQVLCKYFEAIRALLLILEQFLVCISWGAIIRFLSFLEWFWVNWNFWSNSEFSVILSIPWRGQWPEPARHNGRMSAEAETATN